MWVATFPMLRTIVALYVLFLKWQTSKRLTFSCMSFISYYFRSKDFRTRYLRPKSIVRQSRSREWRSVLAIRRSGSRQAGKVQFGNRHDQQVWPDPAPDPGQGEQADLQAAEVEVLAVQIVRGVFGLGIWCAGANLINKHKFPLKNRGVILQIDKF